MKTVTERPTFQGDLMIRVITEIPVGLKAANPVDGKHVLAHSETGHDHVIEANRAQLLIDETNAFIAYLKVSDTATIEHMRSFDTHEPITVQPGIYEIRRQREYIPDGFRRAAD